jgi:tetratricopeptide (TPR) repeat protein
VYSFSRLAAVAALCAGAAAAQKQYKPGEYEAYNAVVKDLLAGSFSQAITDLDNWKTKFPESDFEPDRDVLYMKSYVGAKQWAQAVDEAGESMGHNFDPGQELQVLYNATISIPMIANPTSEERGVGKTAATRLMTFDRRPENLSDSDWTKLRADLEAPARAALLYLAMLPGNQAMTKQPRDCGAAVSAYEKALESYPDSASISYNLATALNCEKKVSEAIYEFERAAAIDPTLGGSCDAAQIQGIADGAYLRVHGSKEGLDRLKQIVKQSPLPPPGFSVKTAAEIEAESDAAFEANHPQLALWKKIQQALSGPDGAQYFETQLKNAAVPQLRGVLVSARPACRPKDLLVAVAMGDTDKPAQAEILLKLETPLTGQPQAGAELQWEGVPSAFTASPFLLTMDTPAKSVLGLKSGPCTRK